MSTIDLLAIGRAAGLAAVGVASAEVLQPARTVLGIRKAAGLAGEMQFTYRNPERSTDPSRILPEARSLIAGALAYGQWGATESELGSQPAGRVARYAWRNHYEELERALQPIADRLIAAGYKAKIVADTNALVDRNVAWLAGLGWYGKNSNLLIPDAGSWFVLGTVVTDAELEATGPPVEDGCGSCNQCIEDCPTDAIIAPGIVDATRCLAWIVQSAGSIPAEFREAIGNRLYGCDDCQDVCPPNRSKARIAPVQNVEDPNQVDVDLAWLLTADDQAVLDRHHRWYIAGRNVDFIRRTALVVLGNVAAPGESNQDDVVGSLLHRYLRHHEPMLRAHAIWAARRLGRDDLLTGFTDDDPTVMEEFDLVVRARFKPTQWAS